MFIEAAKKRAVGFPRALCILGTGLLAACGAPPGEETAPTTAPVVSIGRTEQQLYVDSGEIWDRPNLTVCWDTPGFATEKEWVRTAIRATWEKESNVMFSGWGACPSSADIRITISDEGPHTEGLGTEIEDEDEGMVLNFTFANWSQSCASSAAQREHCIRTIAVHEFGHALGFAHEQNRGDTPSTCNQEQGSDGDTHVGAWDLMSVMNYCNPTWNNGGQLSTTDIQGLRQFYGHSQGPDQQFHVARVDAGARADILQTYRGWGTIPTCRSTIFGWSCSNPSATVYNWGSPEQRYVTGDFNGDGYTDLVQTYRLWASYPVCYATGTGGWNCSNPAATIYDWGTAGQRFITGDFNGDGKTDIAQAYHESSSWLPVCRSTGTGWTCNNPTATLRTTDSPEVRYLAGDFNGDGREDIAQAYRRWTTQPLCLSTGTGWSCTNASVAMYDAGNAEQDFLTGDFNGDGRKDILQAYRGWNAMPLCYGGGSGWSCAIPAGTFYNSGSPEQQTLTGDFNGDGRTDIIQTYRGWGSIPTCYSTGTGWSCSNSPATVYNSGSSEQRFMTADVNGDGRTDVIQVHRGWTQYPVCLSTGTGWNCSAWTSTVYDIGTY